MRPPRIGVGLGSEPQCLALPIYPGVGGEGVLEIISVIIELDICVKPGTVVGMGYMFV